MPSHKALRHATSKLIADLVRGHAIDEWPISCPRYLLLAWMLVLVLLLVLLLHLVEEEWVLGGRIIAVCAHKDIITALWVVKGGLCLILRLINHLNCHLLPSLNSTSNALYHATPFIIIVVALSISTATRMSILLQI